MRFYILLIISILFFQISYAEETTEPALVIEMLNKRDKEKMLYSQDIARVNVGDTIKWIPTAKGHNVQFVSVPDGVDKVKSKLNKEYSYTFDTEGV